MKTLSKEQVLMLHAHLIEATGGSDAILALASGEIGAEDILKWIIEHQQ